MGLAGDKCTYLTLELLVSFETLKITLIAIDNLHFHHNWALHKAGNSSVDILPFLIVVNFSLVQQKVIKRNLQIYTKMTLLKILLSKTETLLIEWMLSRD